MDQPPRYFMGTLRDIGAWDAVAAGMADTAKETKTSTSLQWKGRSDKNTVVWHDVPFASGACRNAYIGFYTDNHGVQPAGKKCVVKMFKHETCWSPDKWNQDMAGMRKAREPADQWNELGLIDKRIEMLTGELMTQRTGKAALIGQVVLVEPFIEGEYHKWNSNSGWVADDGLSVQAFCHWTYHITGGDLLLCDAQGVRSHDKYVVTDPCIMCDTVGKFGMTDCGREGKVQWMSNHKCNQFCHPSWRRVSGGSKRASVRRSTYAWEMTKPGSGAKRILEMKGATASKILKMR